MSTSITDANTGTKFRWYMGGLFVGMLVGASVTLNLLSLKKEWEGDEKRKSLEAMECERAMQEQIYKELFEKAVTMDRQ